MDNTYLIANEIVFEIKPIAVPYNYRTSYKISQLLLILYICCSKGGCSLVRLNMISTSLSTEKDMQQLLDYAEGISLDVPIVRFDPVVTRALSYSIYENLVIQQKDGKFKLSPLGKEYITKVMKEKDLMLREKIFLAKISNKITEKRICEIMANWRYQNVED